MAPLEDIPTWDNINIHLRAWLDELGELFLKHSLDWDSLVGMGFVTLKDRIVVLSSEHAIAISDGTLRARLLKWSAPFARADYPETATALTAEQALKYVLNPEILSRHSKQLAHLILSGVTDAPQRKDYLAECDGCGLRLLRILYAETDAIGIAEGQRILTSMATLQQGGVRSCTASGFSAYRGAFEALNLALPPPERHNDARLATKWHQAVVNLGPHVESTLEREMMKAQPPIDLARYQVGDVTRLLKCIRLTLNKHEAQATGTALLAGGPPATDARRAARAPAAAPGGARTPSTVTFVDGHPNRPFVKDKDRGCSHCSRFHWDADCPHDAAAVDRMKEKRATGAARKARAARKAAKAAAAAAAPRGS
jgi:hypothetical protein